MGCGTDTTTEVLSTLAEWHSHQPTESDNNVGGGRGASVKWGEMELSHSLNIRRRLLRAVAAASVLGALSIGTAGASLLGGTLGTNAVVNTTVQECVVVVVPSTTVTVNATLNVSALGVKTTTTSSTAISTGNLLLYVCVNVNASAQVNVSATTVIGLGGTIVNLNANVVAQAPVTVTVTANGVPIL